MKLRRNSQSYKILKALLIGGGFLLISTISPLGGAQIVKSIIRGYFRKKRFEKERFLRDLKRLQVRELVDYQELPDGRIKVVLTSLGKRKILTYDIDDVKLDAHKRWDGKWRLVIFDIPHFKKNARDAFRHKLRELGFYPVQKSVFLTPYECGDEIDFICSVFDVRSHVLIFTVSNFEGEEKMRHHFEV